MKKIFLIIAALMLLTYSSAFAGNIITYTATTQLTETTGSFSSGLHTNAFNVTITSHTFADGTGTITFAGDVTSIGDYAFSVCSGLTSVTIPESVTSIGEWAFDSCSCLTSITIPESVTSIGNGAFALCSGLTSITIPSSVTIIEDYAFALCSGLTSITCKATTPPICLSKCFNNVNKSIPLYVPAESIAAYQVAAEWKDFTNIQAIPGTGPKVIASGKCGENLTWTLTADSVLTIEGYGEMDEYAWSSLIVPWSSYWEMITSIIFPDGLTSIGSWAIHYCTKLTSVTIPNSVTSIGEYAFEDCSGLTSIIIPSSVTSIGSSAFRGCSGLTSIVVESGNTKYDSRDNCNAIITTTSNTLIAGCKNTIIRSSVTSIGVSAFYGCSGLTSITIPSSVTSIGEYAFYGCSSLTSIIIPTGVTSIGDYAFYGCSGLTSITCEATTTPTCGVKCFANVSTSIPLYVPGPSITQYSQATEWSDFTNIQAIPGTEVHNDVITYTATSQLTVTTSSGSFGLHTNAFNVTITSHTFSNGTGTITFSGDVTSIGDYAFRYCSSLTSVTIPNSVTSIGGFAFDGCSGLTSITIPNSLTSIGEYAFYGCSGLTSITIPNSVTSIEDWAFYGCSGLTSITIPNSVTSIGNGAFDGCSGLTSITIPNSVTSIGVYAFAYCSGLTSITCEATTPPTCGSNCFYNVNKSIPLYVPGKSVYAYKAADQWKDFMNIQAISGIEEPEEPVVQTLNFTVTPSELEAECVVSSAGYDLASGYTFMLYSDSNRKTEVCAIDFDSNGQMASVSIAHAPRRAASKAGVLSFQFTVSGLSSNQTYYYIFTVNGSAGALETLTGSFKTGSRAEKAPARKVLKNGRVTIETDDANYDIFGNKIQ